MNLASKYGNTSFLRAVRENQLQTAKVLAELGANINATDSDGVGAAIISAKNEYYCMAETLVSLGVDVELADNDEYNAIKYALDKYDSKMRKILTVNR